MSRTTGNAHKTTTDWTAVRFEPDSFIRYWQHSAVRMVHANERIFCGMVAAARREMELGQELVQINLAAMQPTLFTTANTDEVESGKSARNMREVERVVTGLYEVSEEIWTSFGEATRLLLHDEEVSFSDCASDPARTAGRAAHWGGQRHERTHAASSD